MTESPESPEAQFEREVILLEKLAAELLALRNPEHSWYSPGGMGDEVSGIQVIGPDGETKQEWHK